MNLQNKTMDSHRGTRIYKCGGDKRKEKKEKKIRNEQLLSQTRRITDFVQKEVNATIVNHAVVEHVEDVSENNEDIVSSLKF